MLPVCGHLGGKEQMVKPTFQRSVFVFNKAKKGIRKKSQRDIKMIGFLIPLLVALETADGILTYAAVGKNLVREANPAMQNIVGTGNFLVMKIAGALLCAFLLWTVHKRFPRITLISTSAIVIFYAVVLTWNLTILFI